MSERTLLSGLGVALGGGVIITVGVGEGVGVGDSDGVGVGLGVTVGDGVGLGEREGEEQFTSTCKTFISGGNSLLRGLPRIFQSIRSSLYKDNCEIAPTGRALNPAAIAHRFRSGERKRNPIP